MFEAEYEPTGPPRHAKMGTLDTWLTECYCLYTVDARGMVYRAERLGILKHVSPGVHLSVALTRDACTTSNLLQARNCVSRYNYIRNLYNTGIEVMQFSAHWCTTGTVGARSPSLHRRQTENCIALSKN